MILAEIAPQFCFAFFLITSCCFYTTPLSYMEGGTSGLNVLTTTLPLIRMESGVVFFFSFTFLADVQSQSRTIKKAEQARTKLHQLYKKANNAL